MGKGSRERIACAKVLREKNHLAYSRNASELECSENSGKWYKMIVMRQPGVRLCRISKTMGVFFLRAAGS